MDSCQYRHKAQNILRPEDWQDKAFVQQCIEAVTAVPSASAGKDPQLLVEY